jgi:hypothetical protein
MSGILNAFVGSSYGTRPFAPTIGTATATSSTSASVTYTPPTNDGGSTITSYTATSSPGGFTGSLSTSGSGTINVSGLTTNTTYTFTVAATNAAGTGASSAASNSIWVAPSPVLTITNWTIASLAFTPGAQMNVSNGYGDVIIVSNTPITVDFYIWGQGAGTDTYGGYTTGRMTLATGQSYLVSSGSYGYSGIFLGSGRVHASSLAIAGASGQPSSQNATGGYGGGTTGQTAPTGVIPAQGGTQSAGGAAGNSFTESTGETAGGPLYGGTGGTNTNPSLGWGNGGAGGAGYYGGGGGAGGGSYQGGGAGGSGYFNPSYISSGSTTQAGGRSSPYRVNGGDPGQGQVVIVSISTP